MKGFVNKGLLLMLGSLVLPAYGREFLISYFEHPQIEKYQQLIEKTYNDIGISVTFVNIEGVRAYLSLEQGLTDAEIIGETEIGRASCRERVYAPV